MVNLYGKPYFLHETRNILHIYFIARVKERYSMYSPEHFNLSGENSLKVKYVLVKHHWKLVCCAPVLAVSHDIVVEPPAKI